MLRMIRDFDEQNKQFNDIYYFHVDAIRRSDRFATISVLLIPCEY
jgi:hypothetical protein